MLQHQNRKTSTIPFGYKLDDNKKTLSPITEELNAYQKAKDIIHNKNYKL